MSKEISLAMRAKKYNKLDLHDPFSRTFYFFFVDKNLGIFFRSNNPVEARLDYQSLFWKSSALGLLP